MTSKANIKKRGETYTFYVYVTDRDGRRRQVSRGGFKTIREAEAARITALHGIQTGTFVRPERVTVAQFLVDEWLPTRKPPVLEDSTWLSYEQKIRLHVVPHIGGIGLQNLTAVDLNNLYRQLLDGGRHPGKPAPRRYPAAVYPRIEALRAEKLTWTAVAQRLRSEFPDACADVTRNACAAIWRRANEAVANEAEPNAGLSPRTVRYIHNIIHAALKDALRWDRVLRNVADAATPPSAGGSRAPIAEAWTADELRTFLTYMAGNRYLPGWLFLATTACRRGEALGLRWQDLDLESATATLGHQVVSLASKVQVKPRSKTKRNHVVRLDPGTVEMLRQVRVNQNETRLFAGAGYQDRDFVFTQPNGDPFHPERFSREFERKQNTYNRKHPDNPLPRLKLHGLRHTWATLALQEGIDIKIVSERLDHSSTHITREIYTHVTPPMQTDAAERVASRMFPMNLH